jgi:glycosyltransferase involved in cell wall biosynthesis
MPLVSVIIPVRNGECFLRETISSVLNQTLQDFELIVVDEASEDHSKEIVQSYGDPRIKIIASDFKRVSKARNYGTRFAQGKFLAFLDQDDLYTPDRLATCVKALQTYPEAGLVYTKLQTIKHFSSPLSVNTLNVPLRFHSENVYPRLVEGNFLTTTSNLFISKEIFWEVGGFNESLRCASDWDFFLRVAKKYKVVHVPAVQLLYRIGHLSVSSNARQMETDCLQIIRREFQDMSPLLKPSKKRAALRNLYHYLFSKGSCYGRFWTEGLWVIKYWWLANWYRKFHWQWLSINTLKLALFCVPRPLRLKLYLLKSFRPRPANLL